MPQITDLPGSIWHSLYRCKDTLTAIRARLLQQRFAIAMEELFLWADGVLAASSRSKKILLQGDAFVDALQRHKTNRAIFETDAHAIAMACCA